MLRILFLAACAAISFYLSTFLINFYSPLLMVGIRGILSGSLIFILQYRLDKKIRLEFIKYKLQYSFALIFGFFVPLVVQSFILDKLPPVEMAIISSTEPILIYTLAYLFFKERLAKKQVFFLILGSFLAFVAIILEAGADRITLISWHEPILVTIIMLTGIGWLTITRLVCKLNQSEDLITATGFLTTGIMAILLSIHLENLRCSFQPVPVILFITLIVFGDLVATRMRVRLAKSYTQTMLALMNIFSPFVIAIHEMIFHDRQYSPNFFMLIVPSIMCFIVFYLIERKYHNELLKKQV